MSIMNESFQCQHCLQPLVSLYNDIIKDVRPLHNMQCNIVFQWREMATCTAMRQCLRVLFLNLEMNSGIMKRKASSAKAPYTSYYMYCIQLARMEQSDIIPTTYEGICLPHLNTSNRSWVCRIYMMEFRRSPVSKWKKTFAWAIWE